MSRVVLRAFGDGQAYAIPPELPVYIPIVALGDSRRLGVGGGLLHGWCRDQGRGQPAVQWSWWRRRLIRGRRGWQRGKYWRQWGRRQQKRSGCITGEVIISVATIVAVTAVGCEVLTELVPLHG